MKSQLKIQEMSFLLVALLFFFILVGLFAISIFTNKINSDANQISSEKALALITNIAESPEFTCGKPNCIDADKLILMKNRGAYKYFWPVDTLILIKSSAFNKSEDKLIECTKSNYPNCDKFIILNSNLANQTTVSSFVSLCWQKTENNYPYNEPGKCEIAKVIAGVKK